MSELTNVPSEAFDVAREEGTPKFEPIPAGTYVAAINDIKVGPLKSGKGQAVLVTWEIDGDKYNGRLIWDRIIVVHESAEAMKFGRRKFKDVADACGVKEAITDLSVLQGKRCLIFVKIETDPNGEYPPKNRIVRVRPIGVETPKANGKSELNDEIPF
jgi:Protein of unknown function (DUF669)